MHTYVYTHTHTHIYTHLHVYIYIHTHIHLYQAVFADEGAFRNLSLLLPRTGASMGSAELDMIRHFPASAEASYCLPNLYAEALAASQVCVLQCVAVCCSVLQCVAALAASQVCAFYPL